MDKITTTIKRQWLREIAARRKRSEYREIKTYWTRRFANIDVPFVLRMINGMDRRAPEITVLIRRIRKNSRSGYFELHVGKILGLRHWDVKRERPTRR